MYARLDSLIRPQSVAVIGASATRNNNGNVVVVNLRAAGFAGAVYPVHVQADEIDGYATLRTIADLPPAVDVGVVSVPASGVLEVLRALDTAGVRSAVDQDGRLVLLEQPQQRRLLDLHDAAERPPAGRTELVPADVAVAQTEQVLGEAHTAAAI